MKHFHAENAARGTIGGVNFDVYAFLAGTTFGIYATGDPKELAALEEEVKQPRSGVTVISAEEHAICVKKKAKTPGLDNYPNLLGPTRPLEGPLNPTVKPAVVVEPDPKESKPEEQRPIEITAKGEETLESALTVTKVVEPPDSRPEEGEKKRKNWTRGNRQG